MGESYGECLKAQPHMGGKVDGCQKFKAWPSNGDGKCSVCGCHVNHKKVVPQVRVTEIVYTECHKNHSKNGTYTRDGCKEFREKQFHENICDACNCDKSFHRNVVTKEVITHI